jgi:hypothetical protein
MLRFQADADLNKSLFVRFAAVNPRWISKRPQLRVLVGWLIQKCWHALLRRVVFW